jgi:hypothetical protein
MVAASPAVEGSWVALAGRRYLWNGAAFERGGAIVETDAAGHFVLSGLEPHAYRVGLARAATDSEREVPSRGILSTATRRLIEAPASGVLLAQDFATLELALSAGDAPSPAQPVRARVHWRQAERSIEFPVLLGKSVFVSVDPHVECELRIEAPGFVSTTQSFDAPAAGEFARQHLSLRRDPLLARLRIQLLPEDGENLEPIGEASFAFSPRGTESPARTAFVRNASSVDGGFELDALPGGAWTINATAGGAYRHYRDSWCEAQSEVNLVPGAQSSCTIALVAGGRLRLRALAPDGTGVGAACEITDPRGQALELSFVARSPQGARESRTRLDARGASEVHPILPAGTYELILRAEGFEIERRLVRIDARKFVDIEAVLVPREVRR